MNAVTDSQLLERFATSRDEAAFSALARRHAAQVRGVCRRVLLDEHDAEETFQATLLVLARKAVILPAEMPVGAWLSVVAFRLALHARSARLRRRERSAGLFLDLASPVPGHELDPAAAAAREEVCSLVRREVAELPPECRAPARLCYLEGKTNEQAARELGWPTGSMSRRLEKARRLLRERLAGRGLLLPSVLFIALGIGLFVRYLQPEQPIVCAAARSSPENGPKSPAFEQLLVRLTAAGASDQDRRHAADLAQAAVATARRLESQAPSERRQEWLRLAKEMGVTARELTVALEHDDEAGTQRTAIRLCAACVKCHDTFRN